MKRSLSLLLLCWALLQLTSAHAQVLVIGHVTADQEAVPFASVGIRGTTLGAAANGAGRYRIEGLPAGTHTMMASALGYSTEEQRITVADGDTVRIDFVLQEKVLQTEGVVVTGTMVETFIKDSPVKVDVVSPRYLEKIPSANVMEVIENVNGLYQQIDCGVCGTNNIRINGMDGPYTAVLIDGMPIMSSLATVYALNGISPALLQQIEVIKGPMSTLYGTEALGGVINLITKNPQTAPRLSVNTFGTTHSEWATDVGVVPTRGRLSTLLSGTLFYNNQYHDENADGFADLTLNTRASVFGKASLTSSEGFKAMDLSARYYYEDRKGGTEAFISRFSDALRGSDQLYGETIRTRRIEVMGSVHALSRLGLRLDVAFNDHNQDSYYGAASYQARQTTYFTQLLWNRRLGTNQTLLLGSALRYGQYDDNTGSTGDYDEDGNLTRNRPDNRLIPGVFGQYEVVASKTLRLLGGLRADYQQDYGPIFSPRLSVKVQPSRNTTLRLNGGTGFRIVNLFTEDHAAYSGARATILLEDLEPERSVSGTVSLQQIFPLGANPLTLDVDAFYTYFTNKIEPDYSVPGEIRYANLDGSATTRGLSVTLSQSLTVLPLSYTVGGTVMDVFREDEGARHPLEFAPRFQGIVNASYRIDRFGLSFDYTMNLTGPMHLPRFAAPFERPTVSPTFSLHNLKINKTVDLPSGDMMQVYLAVENLFNYIQPSPLIDPGNPFGPNFDTSYIYGPIHGTAFGLGLRLMLRR